MRNNRQAELRKLDIWGAAAPPFLSTSLHLRPQGVSRLCEGKTSGKKSPIREENAVFRKNSGGGAELTERKDRSGMRRDLVSAEVI
jgi:hypothetical protein